MSRVQQPVGQVRLTNVAVVRLKKAGKRFEVAAYKNKVMNWRTKVETDINEVLQVATVFLNVSKGIHAKKEDIQAAFGTDDPLAAALVILAQGELEVGERERQSALESLFRDVASIIAEKCMNPDTQRPYTVTIIEKALREIHFNIAPAKSAKQQALKAIAALQAFMPIARARMRLRVTVPAADAAAVIALLAMHHPEWDDAAGGDKGLPTGSDGRLALEPIVEPGAYKLIEDGIRAKGIAGAQVEVIAMAVATQQTSSKKVGDGKQPRGILKKGGGVGGDSEDDDEDDEDEDVFDSHEFGGGAGAGKASTGADSVVASMSTMSVAKGSASAPADRSTVRRVAQPGLTRKLTCGACNATFEDAEGHKQHHRGDWHRYNLKRKVKAWEPVTEEEYAALPVKERDAFLNTDV